MDQLHVHSAILAVVSMSALTWVKMQMKLKLVFFLSIIFAFASDICEWQFAIGVFR